MNWVRRAGSNDVLYHMQYMYYMYYIIWTRIHELTIGHIFNQKLLKPFNFLAEYVSIYRSIGDSDDGDIVMLVTL